MPRQSVSLTPPASKHAQALIDLYPPAWLLQLIELCAPGQPRGGGRAQGKEPRTQAWQRLPDQRRAAGVAPDAVASEIGSHLAYGGNVGMSVPVGVVVLDADTDAAAAHLLSLLPDAPRQRTSRGRHFVLRLPIGAQLKNGIKCAIAPGVEIDVRATGGQIVVSPSRHKSGAVYTWERPLPADLDDLPELSADLLVRLQKTTPEVRTHDTGHAGYPETHETNETRAIPLRTFSNEEKRAIADACQATLPAGPGARNKQIFQFARRLRAMIGDAAPASLREVVAYWHQQAVTAGAATADERETWRDFLRAWPRVRIPFGEHGEAFAAAAVRARQKPNPAALDAARHVGLDSDDELLLAALCAELASLRAGKPFRLPCRAAADVLGCRFQRAWEYLQGFAAVGLLEIIERGTSRSATGPAAKAATFRWKGCP